MKMSVSTIAFIFVLALFSISFAAEIPTDEYIEVTGYGEPGQSFSKGIRAAELNAYRKAAEEINSFQLDSDSTVEEGITQNDKIATRIRTTIQRAKILDEGRQSDGIFYAKVRVYIWGRNNNSVASAIFEKDEPVKPFPEPQFPQPVSASGSVTNNNYTGIIIDCRGLGLTRAMSPVIKNADGQSIYGHENLNYDAIIVQGMASYSASTTDNVARAGSNPLTIKAVNVDGLGAKCNPVVSNEDASKILSANQSAHFLDKCAVVFVQ